MQKLLRQVWLNFHWLAPFLRLLMTESELNTENNFDLKFKSIKEIHYHKNPVPIWNIFLHQRVWQQ